MQVVMARNLIALCLPRNPKISVRPCRSERFRFWGIIPSMTVPVRPLLALPLAIFLVAAADLPDDVPVPVPNPHAETPAPAPEAKPENAPEPEPEAKPEPPPDPAPPPPDEKELAACETALKALGATFTRKPAVDGPGACGMSASYAVTDIASGVEVSPGTELRCETALAAARWVSQVVVPAAKIFGDDVKLTGIRQASTYVCRNRDNLADAKISEHAFGSAIDVSAFLFDGHPPLAVSLDQRRGSKEEAFQMAVRAGACLHFTTVLGPGSDAYHSDHIHLDLAERRGGYRLCQ